MSKEAIILKSEAGGRVLVPFDRRVELVGEFEHSGVSIPRFAEISGVKYQTFAAWRRKYGSLPPTRRSRMFAGEHEFDSLLEAYVRLEGQLLPEHRL